MTLVGGGSHRKTVSGIAHTVWSRTYGDD